MHCYVSVLNPFPVKELFVISFLLMYTDHIYTAYLLIHKVINTAFQLPDFIIHYTVQLLVAYVQSVHHCVLRSSAQIYHIVSVIWLNC